MIRKYLLLAFAFTWIVWIPGTRLRTNEVILTFGTAGPALAAAWVARTGVSENRQAARRVTAFGIIWLIAWTVLEVFPPGTPTLQWPIHWNPWAVPLAMLPAWVLSSAWASDSGIRSLLRTILIPANWRWPVIAFLAIPAYLLIPAAFARLIGLPLVTPEHSNGYPSLVLLGLLMFARAFLFTAAFEEPGWRGMLLPQLQRKYSPLVASLILWFPWMLWHAPLDVTGGMAHSIPGWLEIRVGALIAQAILMTWIYNRSGGCLLPVVLFHAAMNSFPQVLPWSPPMIGLLLVWVVWVVVADRMWRRDKIVNRAHEAGAQLAMSGSAV
jgi:membrane protease YdiL (CAAX protease family)